jgi:hypothetical protein
MPPRPASVLDPRAYMQEGSETGVAVHAVGQTGPPILVGENARRTAGAKAKLICILCEAEIGPQIITLPGAAVTTSTIGE